MEHLNIPTCVYFDAYSFRVLTLNEDFESLSLRSELYDDVGELGLHFADAAGAVRAAVRARMQASDEGTRLDGTVPLFTFEHPTTRLAEAPSAFSPPSL